MRWTHNRFYRLQIAYAFVFHHPAPANCLRRRPQWTSAPRLPLPRWMFRGCTTHQLGCRACRYVSGLSPCTEHPPRALDLFVRETSPPPTDVFFPLVGMRRPEAPQWPFLSSRRSPGPPSGQSWAVTYPLGGYIGPGSSGSCRYSRERVTSWFFLPFPKHTRESRCAASPPPPRPFVSFFSALCVIAPMIALSYSPGRQPPRDAQPATKDTKRRWKDKASIGGRDYNEFLGDRSRFCFLSRFCSYSPFT